MIYKKLESITIGDLQNLIENEVGEGKTIEYKSILKIDSGDERKEFLADITSFANTDGGDIIFGIKENSSSHLPVEINGIEVKNEDELLRQIESILRDSVSPRIPDVDFKLINVDAGKCVLIIRVGASLLLPHRIIYKGYDKFFSRNAKGKYPMDVSELRAAFTMSHSLEQEIENYKKERLASIRQNQYKELEESKPIFVFYSIPLSAFRSSHLFEMKTLINISKELNLPAFSERLARSITIDGIKFSGTNPDFYSNAAIAYYKTNGIVEQATTDFLHPKDFYGPDNPRYNMITINALLASLVDLVDGLKKYYIKLDITLPLLLSCAFINAKDYSFETFFPSRVNHQPKMDRNLAMTPDVYLEDLTVDTGTILRPMLDSIWNAFGYESCEAYDAEDKLIKK